MRSILITEGSIVRGDYKVLYKEEAGFIKVVDVVSLRQSPEVQKNE